MLWIGDNWRLETIQQMQIAVDQMVGELLLLLWLPN